MSYNVFKTGCFEHIVMSGREKEIAVDLYRMKLKPPIYYFFKIDLLGHLIIGVA